MKRLLLILSLICSPACNADPGYSARVVGVTDGDTMTVLTVAKKQVKVRLWGIDAPEAGQDFGQMAKQAASELAFGKEVTLRAHDKDRYGRTVAEVLLPDGKSLNRELVSRGAAWWFTKYAPLDRDLAGRQDEAKAARRGLWSQPNPVPPWEWRHPQVAGNGLVVVNRRSRVYHALNCPSVVKMKETNRITFASLAEAEKQGYRRAGDCR